MKKWVVYVLGVITGIVLTFALAYIINVAGNNSEMAGLNMFEEPKGGMDYSSFEVFQVIEEGCALAYADGSYQSIVMIIPNEGQQFYDNQEIILRNDQCAQYVGTYSYVTRKDFQKTIPAIIIEDGVERPDSEEFIDNNTNSGITLFEKPGECVSRKNFEVQSVLDSGDAIALEIRDNIGGYIYTSDLEVLILAEENNHFYNNQVVKAPKGKCAIQVGNYKYQRYGNTKVIPVVAFK